MAEFTVERMDYQVATNTRPDFYFSENSVNAYSKYYPVDYNNARLVHCVNDNAGNDYGVFTKKELALDLAQKLSKLTPEQRILQSIPENLIPA